MLGLGKGVELVDRAGQEYSVSNYSLSLDGTVDNYVQLTPASGFSINDANEDLSISFWAKRTDNTSGEAVVLGLNSTNSFSRLNFDDDGDRLYIESDQDGQIAYGAVTADTDWHHYAITMQGVTGNSSVVTMYEDGSSVTVSNSNFGNKSTGDAQFTFGRIGTSNSISGTHAFKGLLYQVAMWKAVLDADAVAAIHNSGNPIPLQENRGNYDNARDLFHLWRFHEGSGTATADSNSHSLHDMPGTLVNNATFSTTTP